jgi:hypothetical protein
VTATVRVTRKRRRSKVVVSNENAAGTYTNPGMSVTVVAMWSPDKRADIPSAMAARLTDHLKVGGRRMR